MYEEYILKVIINERVFVKSLIVNKKSYSWECRLKNNT